MKERGFLPFSLKNNPRESSIQMAYEFTDPETLSAKERENGAVFAPKFDQNGLILAITSEAGSNEVLMVA